MANSVAILNKLSRNLSMLGLTNTREATTVTCSGLIISYTDAVVAGPMGGVSAASSPYLGIGIAAPGTIKIKGASGETTVAGMFDSATNLKVLTTVVGFGNEVVIESGDSTTELARLNPSVDFQGMGQ